MLLILLPAVIFIYLIITRPDFFYLDELFQKRRNYTIDDEYHAQKRHKEKELNKLLDKINERGMDSLTDKEKEKLKELSQK
ncbi:MAG TPA: DUF6576 domain-containing protein [Cyclobacteriaceae bacterium]